VPIVFQGSTSGITGADAQAHKETSAESATFDNSQITDSFSQLQLNQEAYEASRRAKQAVHSENRDIAGRGNFPSTIPEMIKAYL
jgi:hypothetical protein